MPDFINWLGIVVGLIIISFGVLYKVFPPKKINHLYGYRTKRSMKNQEVWDYANKIGANMIIYAGLLALVFGIIPLLFSWKYSMLIPNVALLIGLLIGFICCEKLLNKRFNKDGSRK